VKRILVRPEPPTVAAAPERRPLRTYVIRPEHQLDLVWFRRYAARSKGAVVARAVGDDLFLDAYTEHAASVIEDNLT
jgi:hypothetical protein